ncbi:nuclear transport factor 2 family protein [Thalassotalea ganghwensis]
MFQIKRTIFLFIGLLTFVSQSVLADQILYFGNIRYNHVSPHVEIKGVIPLTKEQATNRPHFIFTVDVQNRITSITDHSYNVVKRHHLASLGAYKTIINYEDAKEIRTFFDINNTPMANIKGVYKEVYSYDKNQFKQRLDFYDENDSPMESRWKISQYKWQEHNNLIIENRFNLKGEKQPLSPYFAFGTTAIEYDENGNPSKHFNIDSNLQVTNNEVGVAYYQDEYLESGLHTKYSYFDNTGRLVNNPWGFSYAVKHYDDLHNYHSVSRYNSDKELLPPPRLNKTNSPISDIDEQEVLRVSRGYLEALQQLKPELMKEVMHEELSKHTIQTFADSKQKLRPTTYAQMINFAHNWNKDGTRFPPNPTNKVIILDSYNGMASVKLISDNWVEYLHLLKIEGKWKIKNLVWDYNAPENKP